jgi:hypothetical protein
MINYYGNFIHNLSTIAGPLHNLLKKDVVFKWNDSCIEAFNEIKNMLSSNQVLTHFNPNLPIVFKYPIKYRHRY